MPIIVAGLVRTFFGERLLAFAVLHRFLLSIALVSLCSPSRGVAAELVVADDRFDPFGKLYEIGDGIGGAAEIRKAVASTLIPVPISFFLFSAIRSLSITDLKDSGSGAQSRASSSPPSAAAAVAPDAAGSGRNISRDGDTVVGFLDNGFSTPSHAFRWTATTGIIDLGTFDPVNADTLTSFAHDVSDDGSVVVGQSKLTEGASHAFRWTEAGGMVDLGSATGAEGFSTAFGVSGDGSILVGDSSFPPSSFRRAFRWTQTDGFEQLVGTDVTPEIATAISRDGTTIVGRGFVNVGGQGRRRAFRWTEAGGAENLGVLPGHAHSTATAVSDDGAVVVGFSALDPGLFDNAGRGRALRFDPGRSRAFYWTEATGMQDLGQLLADGGVDMTGITLIGVTGMTSNADWMSVLATTPDTDPGETVPVFVTLPEPTHGGVAALTAIAFLSMRRCRRQQDRSREKEHQGRARGASGIDCVRRGATSGT